MLSVKKELLYLESQLAILTSQGISEKSVLSLICLVRKNLLSLAAQISCLDEYCVCFEDMGSSGNSGSFGNGEGIYEADSFYSQATVYQEDKSDFLESMFPAFFEENFRFSGAESFILPKGYFRTGEVYRVQLQ